MKRFASIGHPVKNSRSPALHRAGFREFGIDAEFEAIDIPPEKLKSWIQNDFLQNYSGAAVTMPHKIAIRNFVDFETEAVQKIGAINIITMQDGKIVGSNTDGVGALKAILTTIDPKDKKVLILGAGGAARAIAFALKTAGAQVAIWNRTQERAQKLAEEFDIGMVENIAAVSDIFDIVINATPIGTKKPKSLVPENFWKSKHTAFDIVYEPLMTKFLTDAENAGAKIITGDKMLVHQALAQFKIWHNVEPEPEIFERAFFEDPL